MSSTRLAGEIRDALTSPKPTDSIPELTARIHSYVAELSSFSSDASASGLDETLQQILNNEVDQQSIPHIHLVLAALDALDKTVSTESIILTWFDLLLRPSLKSMQLPLSAQKHTRNVVLRALHDPSPAKQEIVTGFQNRIMQLYLLDTSSISSGDELVEKMSWREAERLQGISYKSNLETILVDFFDINPQEFIEVFLKCFEEPPWRLQLILLLKRIVISRSHSNPESTRVILRRAFPNLIKSLLIDTSSTLFNVTLRVCVQILPHLVLQDAQQIPTTIPLLLLVLQRGLCWTQHPRYRTQSWPHNPHFSTLPHDIKQSVTVIEGDEEAGSIETVHMPTLHGSVSWKMLGSTFDTAGFTPPAPATLLQFLIGMFPSNTLLFLRSPIHYLSLHPPQPLFTVNWGQMIDSKLLKERASPLLQRFRMPAGLVMFDDQTHCDELTDLTRWHNCSVASIAGACALLDTIHVGKEYTGHGSSPLYPTSQSSDNFLSSAHSVEDGAEPDRKAPPIDSSSQQDTLSDTSFPPMRNSASVPENLPSQVSQAIASLQRENLLLRNELDFELWLKMQNSSHSRSLYKDAIKLRTEAEADTLKRHKTLVKYRRRYTETQTEFKAHKEQASTSIHELKTWNKAQEDKVAEMRKKERAWSIEAATLKERNRLREATIEAQNKLIEEGKKKIFQLETEMKAMKPKVDRVDDFEARTKQLENLQRLWDKDVEHFNAQANQIQTLIHDHQHMSLRLASLEAANKELRVIVNSRSKPPSQSVPVPPTSKSSQEFVKNLIAKIKSLEVSNKSLMAKCEALSSSKTRTILEDEPLVTS